MHKIRIEDESKNIGSSAGHIDSPIKLIIRTLIISSLNIIDLILSIISFDNECLTFFILKYISIPLTFLMWVLICASYSFIKGSKPIPVGVYTCLGCIIAVLVIAMEITILVFFIRDYDVLNLLAIIGYFIHWINIPISIIIEFTHCCGCELFTV